MYFQFYGWHHICSQAKVARRHRPAEVQCTCSLRLGYKLCAVIPIAGQRTHRTTFQVLKVTYQMATTGVESAVYDCLVWHRGFLWLINRTYQYNTLYYKEIWVSSKASLLISGTSSQTLDLWHVNHHKCCQLSSTDDHCHFITLSVHPCVQHYGHDAARLPGLSAAAW